MAIKPVEILIKAKDQTSGVFDLVKKNARSLGLALVSYFGFKSFVGAIQGAAELEGKLSEVRAVSGATADEMVKLRQAAEEAGATTKFTATEAADALGNLSRSGLNAASSIAALPSTLALAQAGGIELAESSSLMTKALAGFGLQATESARVADVLAKGANSANTNVTGLGQALSYAAPTAVSLGLSLEDTVAIIGKFADAGIDASRAGTALNSILAQFSNPASIFRRELAAAGITTDDFNEALKQLEAAGPGGQKAILAVGQEAGPALRALLNQGIGSLDELREKLMGAEGAAKATADTMENNLQGASRGLASAWDTVKNALATPVLPVLKDGVQSLAQSLRDAVSSGVVGRFGEAIANGFQAALTWARAFIAEVDFAKLANDASAAADRVSEGLNKLAGYAVNAGNTVKLIWGVMSAGANTVLTLVYTVGEAFAGVASNIQSGIALMLQGLSKVTFGSVSESFAQAATDMRISAEATWAASEELASKARESLGAVADGATLAREGWAGLTDASADAAAQAATSDKVFKQLGETLKEVGGDATAAGQKQQAAAILQTEAARKVRAEVELLKREYEAALRAGDVQVAVGKLQQMQRALGQTADTARSTAAEVASAFQRMGLQTKDELSTAAENAKRDFETIKQSGLATTEGLAQAWRQASDAAIAAAGGIVPAWVSAQASAQGYELALDEAGKATLRLKGATDSAGDSANRAAGGYRNMAQSAAEAAAAAKNLAEINSRHSRPGQNSTQTGDEPNYDPGRNMYGRAGQNDQPFNGNGQTQAEFQRGERLAGQNAVDNTLMFRLRDKLNAGALTEADAADIQAVIAALEQNEQVNRDLDRMNPAAFSLTGAADRNEWNNVRARLQQALGSMGAGLGKTVRVDINTGRGRESVNTDEKGAQAIVRALQSAGLSAGR
ncbi:MAG: phage tail tape measure protein [Hydrogenophaga sp.]